MKAGWDVKTVGEIADHCLGKMLDKRKNRGTPRPYLRNLNVRWFDFNLADILEMKFEDHETERYTAIRGDVLVCEGGYPGRAAIWDKDEPIYFQKAIHRVRFHERERNRWFLYYLLKCDLDGSLKENFTGAGIQHFTGKSLSKFTIPLPPLGEQQRIVAILDEAFEGLDRAKANAETNLASAGELFEALLADAFCPTKKEWEECALNDHVNFIDYRGKTPPKTEKGVRLITAKNVKMGYIQQHPEEFILESAYEGWMTRGFPAAGDVLFTTEAPLANVAQLDTDETVVIGQRLITMQADPDVIVPEFLKFALMSPPMQREIHSRGTGATVIGIKAKLLKTVPLRFPRDLADQWNVAERCRNAYAEKQRLEAEYQSKLDGINELRQSLLAKAFAGELT